MKKANELRTGDKISVRRWDGIKVCTVMDVTAYGENFSIMAKTKDGFKEYVIDIFAKSNDQFALAA